MSLKMIERPLNRQHHNYWLHQIFFLIICAIITTKKCVANAEIANPNYPNFIEDIFVHNHVHRVGRRSCKQLANFNAISKTIDDIEDLELNVSVNIALDNQQMKRFSLVLNTSTPLTITFSQNVRRKLFYNQTINLVRSLRPEQHAIVLPCALSGEYDLFLHANHRGSIKLEAQATHPHSNWSLLSLENPIHLRTQNRIRRRQMIVKWHKSKIDFHAVQYCLVISARQSHRNFCSAAWEYYTSMGRKLPSCFAGSILDYVWLRPPERSRKIDPHITNIICTGSRTKQLLRGVIPNTTYHIDIFGVHTKLQNLTFHIASKAIEFKRTHPKTLKPNHYGIERIMGPHGRQVFSFKIPPISYHPKKLLQQQQKQQQKHNNHQKLKPRLMHLRYLLLPCDGSEINATILQKREVVAVRGNIYRPTYLRVPHFVGQGERFIARFIPSNEDEILRATKLGIAVGTTRLFSNLAELPANVTVFEVRSYCTSTTIAWYNSPDQRNMSYCIIVLLLPQHNHSLIDYTNYCQDFGKRIMQHPHFHSLKCNARNNSSELFETHTIYNLTPGKSYLVYVTAKLINGKALPYQSLKVDMSYHCSNEILYPPETDSPLDY